MDLQYFLNILWRRKWLILASMLVAALTAFYLVGKQSYTYKAYATVSTGIMGEQGLDQSGDNPWIQEYQIKMHFSNLITLLHSRKNLDFLTYKMLLHDTDHSGVNAEQPFRTLETMEVSEDLKTDYGQSTMFKLHEALEEKLYDFDFTFEDYPESQEVFTNLSKAYKYDRETLLRDNFETIRSGESDNVVISFVSENPELSAWAVNTFCETSIAFNKHMQGATETKRLNFDSGELQKKKIELDEKRLQLKNYKSAKGVVDVKASSDALVSREKGLKEDREEMSTKTGALKNNIKRLGKEIAALRKNKVTLKEEEKKTNEAIKNTDEQIKKLKVEYEEGNYEDEAIEKRLQFLNMNRDILVKKYVEQQVKAGKLLDLQNTIDDLARKKADAESELEIVSGRKQSIDLELAEITGTTNTYVNIDAQIGSLQSEIEILTKDYEALLRTYENKKRTYDGKLFFPLRILEYAQNPDKAEPRFRAIITAFAGIVGAVLATIAILLTSFFDSSLNSPAKFEKYAEVSLISTINRIKTKNLNINELFSSNGHKQSHDNFKESIRNLRFAMESSGAKRFLFTSTKKEEGKTFLMLNLAHTLKLKGKKVLLVDTNFKNNSLTQMSQQGQLADAGGTQLIGESHFGEQFVSSSTSAAFHLEDMDILGNKGSFLSPSEVFAGKDFKHMINRFAEQYDYVFLEGAAMNDYSDSKELIDYVDKVIVIFAADSEIRQADRTDLAFLRGLGAKFMGAVLNKVDLKDLK